MDAQGATCTFARPSPSPRRSDGHARALPKQGLPHTAPFCTVSRQLSQRPLPRVCALCPATLLARGGPHGEVTTPPLPPLERGCHCPCRVAPPAMRVSSPRVGRALLSGRLSFLYQQRGAARRSSRPGWLPSTSKVKTILPRWRAPVNRNQRKANAHRLPREDARRESDRSEAPLVDRAPPWTLAKPRPR